LQSITIIPSNPTVAVGSTVQLMAIGNFSDGSMQDLTDLADWTSSNNKVAHVITSSSHTNGRVIPRKAGTTTITATGDILSGSMLVTVTP
jgi:uncharacterized protein YjdB